MGKERKGAMRARQAREAADAERLRLEKEARLKKRREAKEKAKGKRFQMNRSKRLLSYAHHLCFSVQQKRRLKGKRPSNRNNKMLSMNSSSRALIQI